ncbi:hypothetical protein AB0M46_43200 [Dactylosporangium sp. NPDC051485]|uniref:hypothetical protein n=1 Tax=Dactylosporangium sp. NPDC051485 TaxID=3154846 RepID=UPI00343B73F3
MGLWLKVHREVAGAWRSACYDLSQHATRRRALRLRMAETAEYAPRRHRGQHVMPNPYRSRFATGTGVALLVAGGAAGTYLAVAGGLTALRAESHETPLAGAPTPVTTEGAAPGPSAIRPTAPAPTQPRPQVRRSSPPQVIALPEVPAPVGVPATQTSAPESTQTPPASPTPSASASPSPSASGSSPSPTPTKLSKWGRNHIDDEGR